MSSDLPTMPFMALYIISIHIIQSNSRTSTHWKLSGERVIEASNVISSDVSLTADTDDDDSSEVRVDTDVDNSLESMEHDPLFGILTAKVNFEGGWQLIPEERCLDCGRDIGLSLDSNGQTVTWQSSSVTASSSSAERAEEVDKNSSQSDKTANSQSKSTAKANASSRDVLDCGTPVNSTKFDHLRGIASRGDHPHIPEPEVALIFKKKSAANRNAELDMSDLEQRLRKTLKERPNSPQVYNQIGNFWRIKGNTQISIDCFRKALSIAPNNADVLLNLARVLFNLQFLDDAIFLTRRSLEVQTPDQNAWLQHYTLGEILKAYGHFQEATHHFRHTLELKRNFQPAQAHLREMEASPDGTVTYYTLFIILFLVMGVLCGFLTTVETKLEEYGDAMKSQRHFNRAMAMRKMTVNINPRLMRAKKSHC